MGIVLELVRFAEDEGKFAALDNAQRYQLVLEEMSEFSKGDEQEAARLLIKRVNQAISELAELPSPK